jgi:hypothetical protein
MTKRYLVAHSQLHGWWTSLDDVIEGSTAHSALLASLRRRPYEKLSETKAALALTEIQPGRFVYLWEGEIQDVMVVEIT